MYSPDPPKPSELINNSIFNVIIFSPDVQMSCVQAEVQFIPPVWVMCLESVAHLLVMFNFSSNFLVYCSVSQQFKSALSRVCQYLCGGGGSSGGSFTSPNNILIPCPNKRQSIVSSYILHVILLLLCNIPLGVYLTPSSAREYYS